MIAYSVNQRTPEIGLRVALGASTMNVMRLVLSQGALQLGIGLALGSRGIVRDHAIHQGDSGGCFADRSADVRHGGGAADSGGRSGLCDPGAESCAGGSGDRAAV